MRRSAKRDYVEFAIVQVLRDIGVQVWHISVPGLPDLLTYSRGRWLPIEIKRSPTARLTPAQQQTYQRAQFPIVSSPAEALALFGVTT